MLHTPVTAVDILLAGLIDYAGLFPPANLDMRPAVQNYLRYLQGRHEHVLGRFIVDLSRVDELRATAGADLADLRVSVLVPPYPDLSQVSSLFAAGLPIQAIEFKYASPADVKSLMESVPHGVEAYFEVPVTWTDSSLLSAISDAGARVKLRMGGVVAESFPSSKATAAMLAELATRHISFKATGGLHHPIRSRHHLTYEVNSPVGMMHGFLNFAFAAVLLHHGGAGGEALHILEEEDRHAWRVAPDAISCRAFLWNRDQLADTRKNFWHRFGSCSFEEPIRDLEAMGWL
jgi:hypothetical protein